MVGQSRGKLLTPEVKAILPAVLLAYAAMAPQEVRLDIAGQNLFSYRIIGLLLLPWLTSRLVTGRLVLTAIDWLILLAAAWITVSFAAYYGFAEGFGRGVALSLDLALPYLIARASIKSLQDLRRFLVLIAPGVIFSGFIMALESLSQRFLVKPFAGQIFSPLGVYNEGASTGVRNTIRQEFRLGLMRAYGPFPHPILAGLFLSGMIALYWPSQIKSWPRLLAIVAGLCAFFSLSSASFLALMIVIGLLGYEHFRRYFATLSWPLFIWGAILGLVVLEVITEANLLELSARFSISSGSAYNRIRIIEYGLASIANYPVFGIGFENFERPSWMVASVDNHWILWGIRSGVLVPVTILFAAILTMVRCGRRAALLTKADRQLQIGLNICFFTFLLCGATVAFFGGVQTWFHMLFGICVSASAVPFEKWVNGWKGQSR